jgi:hypothetical protein
MKNLILSAFLILLAPFAIFAKCYLLLDGQHKLSQTVLQQVALIELTRHVEPIDDTPPTGISDGDCVYRLTLAELDSGVLLVIKGPRLTSYAESQQQGIPGFQQALFRAIIKEDPSRQPAICEKNGSVMGNDCRSNTQSQQPIVMEQTVYDRKTALTWQKAEAGKMTWDAAISYCENLEWAGFDDWRLPSATELKSSYRVQTNFPQLEQDFYWSASIAADDKHYAWGLTVADGSLFTDWIKNRYFVRCTRGEKLQSPLEDQDSIPEAQDAALPDTRAERDNQADIFPVGIRYGVAPTYISGYTAVYKLYIHNMEEQGYKVKDDSGAYPIGIAFRPYFQNESGLRYGVGIGPAMAILISTTADNDSTFIALPIDATIGYTLQNGLYFRGGLSKLNASGDFVVSESLGAVGAVGMEIKRFRVVSLGVETGLDTATVTLKKYDCSGSSNPSDLSTCDSETVQNNTVGFMMSFLVIF